MSDLVHDLEAIHGLCLLLTASGIPFSEISVMPVNLQFSQASLLFRKLVKYSQIVQ